MYYEHRDSQLSCFLMNHGHLTRLAHMHREVEVIFCRSGHFDVLIQGDRYSVGEGEFSIAFPNRVHYYEDNGPISFVLLLFDPSLLSEFESLFFGQQPVRPVGKVRDPEQTYQFFSSLALNREKSAENELRRHGYLELGMADLLESLAFSQKKSNDSETDILSQLIDYCNDHCTCDLHLCDLEENLHISRSYISHLFRKNVNMSFTEYLHSLRIAKACRLLRETDDTVTSISYSVGYNTVRNFNRFFLKQTGLTPGEYRKKPKEA